MNDIKIVISAVTMPDGEVYFSAFNISTGEKIAPWSDGDSPEKVLEALLKGVPVE